MMTSAELRQKFLDFMASKGHAIIPSGSVVPKEDPTVLFINSGMQPLVPYLTGMAQHPDGVRLANSQKCLRTEDLEEVGDNRHGTFFEMLGFWSIGDYFKTEAIEWSFEFMTSPQWLGLDPERLYVTVYKGSELVEADIEAADLWKEQFAKLGMNAELHTEYDFKNPENNLPGTPYLSRISMRSGADNWWGLPYKGPCGPCAEMYYVLPGQPTDFRESLFPHMTLTEIADFVENQVVEIGNNVFMTYEGEKNADKEPKWIELLKKKNIDTGLGFERLLMMVNDKDTMFKTDVLAGTATVAEKWAKK
jgi:alanyl-tRNA synthetase